MDLRLLVVQGKPEGKEIPIRTSRFVIGRSPECHLRPNSDLISRTHCQINIENEVARLKDLGSSNGTIVNGERVSGEVTLNDGDLLQIGPLAFQIVLAHKESAVAAPAAASPAVAAKPAAAPVAAVPAGVGARESSKIGSREAKQDDIEQWLLSDAKGQVPDTGSGVYKGDTQLLNISSLQDTTEDAKASTTPPDGIPTPSSSVEEKVVEVEGGAKLKIGGGKQKIEKTREDTSRAAGDILRRMMERRPRNE